MRGGAHRAVRTGRAVGSWVLGAGLGQGGRVRCWPAPAALLPCPASACPHANARCASRELCLPRLRLWAPTAECEHIMKLAEPSMARSGWVQRWHGATLDCLALCWARLGWPHPP